MASPSLTHASPDLQNSYGPEMAASEHQSSYGPESVPADAGLEALPGQQIAAPAYISYAQQAEKNGTQPGAAPPIRKRRFLGLPMWGLWFLVGMAIVVLGVALGAGLGVGLSQRSTTNASSSASTASSVSSSTTAPATATTATPTTSVASTTTSSTTSSSTSAAATTSANVEICQNAYLDYCTTISVPAGSCIDFPAAYNDAVSSVDTGGPVCLFYTDSSCTGDYWSTNGTQNLIPGEFNDAFSSVTCD